MNAKEGHQITQLCQANLVRQPEKEEEEEKTKVGVFDQY